MNPDTGPVREAVVARLRSHGRAMALPIVLLVAASAGLGYFAGRFEQQWQNLLVLGGGLLVIVLGFLLPLSRWLARNYIITTRRLVLRHGVFVQHRQELLHSRGYDVTVRRSTVQAVFGSGDVLIDTGAGRPVVLRDVPSAGLVQAALHDLMESAQVTLAARRRELDR